MRYIKKVGRRVALFLATSIALFTVSAIPASAETFDDCTVVRATRGSWQLVFGTIRNLYEEYGWPVIAVLAIVAIATSATTRGKNPWWGRVAWGVVGIAVIGYVIAAFGAAGGSGC